MELKTLEAKWLITSGKPHAGIRHRPDEIGGVAWAEASQPARWRMVRDHFSGEVLDDLESQQLALHVIADGHDYTDELAAELAWGRKREAIFAQKHDHPEGYQAALDELTPEDREAYDRWERIWEDMVIWQTALEVPDTDFSFAPRRPDERTPTEKLSDARRDFDMSKQRSGWLAASLGELMAWANFRADTDVYDLQVGQKELVSWAQAERGEIPEPKHGLVVLNGPRGSGKDTLAGNEILKDLWVHTSTGAICRERGTKEQRTRMNAGELLSDDEVIAIMDEVLDSVDPNLLLSNGFPRTLKQADWLVEQGRQGRFDLSRAVLLYIRADEESCKYRLLGRGREDDTEDAITKRLADDRELNEPVMARLQEGGFTLIEVDGNQTPEIVAQQAHDRLFGSQPLAA